MSLDSTGGSEVTVKLKFDIGNTVYVKCDKAVWTGEVSKIIITMDSQIWIKYIVQVLGGSDMPYLERDIFATPEEAFTVIRATGK